MMKQM